MPGVAKCGTTTLYDLLVAHPRVTGGIEKEVRFLMDPGDRLCPSVNITQSGLGAWASQYADEGKGDFDIWLDASPQYQYQRVALNTIATLDPQPKILFIVRDPARRLFSLYQYARYHQRAVPWITSFKQFVDAIRDPVEERAAQLNMLRSAWRDTQYDRTLEDWSAIVPAQRLFVTSVEELTAERTNTLNALGNWLGIDAQPLIEAEADKSNPTVVTKSRLLRAVGMKVAKALPENAILRRAKDFVRTMNSAPVNRAELEENEDLLEQLGKEFAPHMERFEEMPARLAYSP